MIYPVTLYNFGKVCKSSLAAGNVLRALCKQAVKLTPEEETIFAMIQNDSGWMDERWSPALLACYTNVFSSTPACMPLMSYFSVFEHAASIASSMKNRTFFMVFLALVYV